MVTVNSGAISYRDKPEDVPVDKWDLLMSAKRYHMDVSLTADCRCLVQFVAEAEIMYSQLGFDSASQMIADGYRLQPDEIRIAKEWLEINEPDSAVGLKDVIKLAEDIPVGEATLGRPPKGVQCTPLKKGNSKERTVRRIARDRPDLFEKVKAGELSANAAAIEAGFRRKKISVYGDNLDDALKQLEKHYGVVINRP